MLVGCCGRSRGEREGTVDSVECAVREGSAPRVFGMDAREPLTPVWELQRDGNFARVKVAVGTEEIGSDLRDERAEVRGCCVRRRRRRWDLIPAVVDEVGQRVGVVGKNPCEARARGPVGDGLVIETRAGLVGRVPGTAGIREWEAANVAGDLFALERREAVETRAGDDAGVGEVEIFEVAAVFGGAVGAGGANAGGGEEIEGEDALAAGEAVGMIEAEAEGICAGDEGIGWELKSEGDGGEGSADAAERLGGVGDGDGVVW